MTAPKIGERHIAAAYDLWMLGDPNKPHDDAKDEEARQFMVRKCAEKIAKHFPEDDENVARIDVKLAADRISALSPEVFETIGTYKTVLEIINGCRRGEE